MDDGYDRSISDKQTQRAIVLVFDDDPATTDFLVQALTPFYRTFSALSGEDAIGFCASHAPDLVILDLHMLFLDGLLTCKMLKAILSMLNCPIVFRPLILPLSKKLNAGMQVPLTLLASPSLSKLLSNGFGRMF